MRNSEGAEGSDRFFSRHHSVAAAAAKRCADGAHRGSRVGGVACGRCWELAIRDDERVAVLFGLPREFSPDLSYVDVVAVERACAGEPVRLTAAERVAAVKSLRQKAIPPWRISVLLRLSPAAVVAVLADLAAIDVSPGSANQVACRAVADVA